MPAGFRQPAPLVPLHLNRGNTRTSWLPQGSGQEQYLCTPKNLPNGPNAVTLAGFSVSRVIPAWLLAPIGLAAAVFAFVRAR